MKVKIAYTVDLDDIPIETAKMLENVSPKVEKLLSIIANCKKQIVLDDILNATKSLEKMNSTIYECSLVVNDCHSILSDYVTTKFKSPSEASTNDSEEG